MGVRFCNNCCAIGRRLAAATKACLTRRTWGEMVLRFFLFLAPAEAAVFFLTDGLLAGVLLVEAGLDVALFDVVLWAGALAAGDGASSVSTGDLDWATAGGTKASQTEGENCNEIGRAHV